ncbi:MAG: hypothetical protein HKP06_09945 [Flavobacteriaceae bacterium]|nr:hypothetical protein [Flavobacteriaceae bacterium]
MRIKKTFKIIGGLIVFITLPSLLFFGFLYLKYDEDLPKGISGEKADLLANKMLDALNHEAYEATNYIEWTFKGRHHFKWEKDENICDVQWAEYKVRVHLDDTIKSRAYVHNFEVKGLQRKELLKKAIDYFNNDSFWLVAPYKVYDPGVERSLITQEDGSEALLVTYTSGGNTPGDSYLWLLDETGKPYGFKMWTSIIPIQGFPASWSDWKTTESGAQLPTHHKLLFLGLDMGEVKGTK